MDQKLTKLENHYIVCGYGRIGKVICQSLKDNNRKFVIIENHHSEIQDITKKGFLFVEGDAANDEILVKAGIMRAKGLIAVVSSDAENVYITLSAKELNSKVFVMSRTSDEGAETKLLRAGADKVISPYYIGARQMANTVLRPTVIDFLDLTVHAGDLGLRLEELVVPESASFVNMSLMDSGIRKNYQIIVVAIKRKGHEKMIFNPSHLTIIEPGDIIIILGEHDDILRLEQEL